MKFYNRISITQVVTGANTRWSYASVWKPRQFRNSQPKCSVVLLIPKTDTATVDHIRCAIEEAYHKGVKKFGTPGVGLPYMEELKNPFEDGDVIRPNDESYKNCYALYATCSTPPKIEDRDGNPITRHSEVYSGVFGRAVVHFFVYNNSKGKGFACHLDGLIKYYDGEHIGNVTLADGASKSVS